jgi:hypothetical protein
MTSSSKVKLAFVFGGTLLVGNVCLGAPASSNPGTPFQRLFDDHSRIESVVNEIPGIADYIELTAGDEMDLLRILQRSVTVMAKVDTAICASLAVQCGPENAGPASNLNDSPVRLFVQVIQYGRGVEGLQPDAFTFANPFFPAGGREVHECTTCGDEWFHDGGKGLYSIFLAPAAVPQQDNWKPGEYAATIEVKVTSEFSGEHYGTALVTFDIPTAFNVDE